MYYKKLLPSLFIACLCCVHTVSSAESASLDDLSERISFLESSNNNNDNDNKITINGYSSFEFERQLSNDGNGDTHSSFDADLLDIVLNVQVNNRLRVAADITWEHGAASEDDRGNVALEYGFAEYTFSNTIKLRAGKMFIPFGIFNEVHTAKPAYLSVKEAGSTNKPKNIIDGAPRFYPRWAVGIALTGNTNIDGKAIDYHLMLSNGEQEDSNPFEEDNNVSKAFSFRTRYDATDNLRIGYSLYYDNGLDGGVKTDVLSQGIQIEYQNDSYNLLFETVIGEIDTSPGISMNHIGWFFQPSYSYDNGLTPYFRLEHYDPNTNISSDDGYDAILGINYNYNDMIFKLENNYYFGASDSALNVFPGDGYHEIKAAIVVGF